MAVESAKSKPVSKACDQQMFRKKVSLPIDLPNWQTGHGGHESRSLLLMPLKRGMSRILTILLAALVLPFLGHQLGRPVQVYRMEIDGRADGRLKTKMHNRTSGRGENDDSTDGGVVQAQDIG